MPSKPKTKTPKFLFNDETVENSHGFYIRTSGISLGRFKDNPVMLSDHYEWTFGVIGNWVGISVNNGRLTATPVFDLEDEHAKMIAGKVERGFLKGCSMGIIFDPDDLVNDGDKIILTKCELVECSIVAVPSNKKSIRLYKKEGELYESSEIKTLCLSVKNETFKEEPLDMKKIVLSVPTLMALGITNPTNEGVDQSVLENMILTLSKENQNLKTANQTMNDALAAEKLAKANDLITKADDAGKFKDQKHKEAMLELAKKDYALAESTLDVLPGKASLSAQQINPSTQGEVKTMEDFQKLSHSAQLAFKEEQPEEYQKILKTI